MALTLAESAVLSKDQLAQGVMETFVQESPILDRLPLMGIEGNAFTYNKEGTLPGVAFRAVNEAYDESTGTFNPGTERLFIMGGDADVDTFIQQTRSNLNDQRAAQTRLKVKAASYAFQNAFINGNSTVNPKEFDGLKNRLVNKQVLSAATNGLGIVEAGHDFFDALDALMAAVPGCSALYMNALIRAKIRSSARRLGGWQSYKEIETGKVIESYNGIPLLDVGEKPDGTLILPQDEVQGTSNDCSSIYAVKFGQDENDGGVTGLTNGGVQVKDLGEIDAKPVYRTRLEFFCGVGVFGGKAAARLSGVRNR